MSVKIWEGDKLFVKLSPGAIWFFKAEGGGYTRALFISGGQGSADKTAEEVALYLFWETNHAAAVDALDELGWHDVAEHFEALVVQWRSVDAPQPPQAGEQP